MPKVVLITGCSSGLGRALALHLHAERRDGGSGAGERAYSVFATARNTSSLKELEAEGIRTLQLDVTSQKSVDAAVKRVVQEAGHIDVLINNAGLSRVGPIIEQPLSELEEVMGTNYFGVVRVTQAVAPHMMRQRSGLVVMIGSVVSMLATPFGGAYTASKAALLALSDSLRLELHPFGVHVTYVVAGSIKSSFSDNILSNSPVARYEKPSSLYAPLAPMIKARANMSQEPASSVTAAATAEEIAAVINGSMLPALTPSSAYSLAGLGSWCSASAAALVGRATSGFQAGSGSAPAGSASGSEAGGATVEYDAVWKPRPPPNWFLAGGNARRYFLEGVAQKLMPGGWPTNTKLAKKFGLNSTL